MTVGVLTQRTGVAAARRLAEDLLDGDRLLHTVGVAARAEDLVGTIADDCSQTLVAAAWLHDIGYGPDVVDTGFHPLDGARLLDRLGWPARVSALVAHHSGARFLAGPLGVRAALAGYRDEATALSEALTYADQTTGPRGERMPIEQRMAGMLARHGPGSVQAVVHRQRGRYLLAVAHRVQARHALSTVSPLVLFS